MSIGFDTNILIYALDHTDPAKHAVARRVLDDCLMADTCLAAQVLGEYLNVARRKMPDRLHAARQSVADLGLMVPIVPTTLAHVTRAGAISDAYRLQFWDALIIAVYESVGVSVMLTEDLQDGLQIDGVEIINPLEPVNADRVKALLQT